MAGHGKLLQSSVGWALQATGAFELVAGDAAKDAALKKVFEINSGATSDKDWVEVGQAVGATHLMTGEVRQTPTGCSASVEIVELVTQKSRLTRPEIYDCSEAGLVDLAPDLSLQLTGKKLPAELLKKSRRLSQAEIDRTPLKIRVDGKRGSLDGRRITYDENEDKWGDPHTQSRPERPEPVPIVPTESPDAGSLGYVPPPDLTHPAERLGKHTSSPATDLPTFEDVRLVLGAYGPLIAWAHGLLPVVFFVLAFLWKGSSESLAAHLVGVPLALTFLSSVLAAGALAFTVWTLRAMPFSAAELKVMVAPLGGFVLSLIFARILFHLGDVPAFLQIRRLLLLSFVAVGVGMYLSSPKLPVVPLMGLGMAFVIVFWVGRARRKKEREAAADRSEAG